jgi:hypothetical protein
MLNRRLGPAHSGRVVDNSYLTGIREELAVIRPSDKGAYQERPPTWRTRLAGLVKADAVEQVREARVAAHRIKERMHF